MTSSVKQERKLTSMAEIDGRTTSTVEPDKGVIFSAETKREVTFCMKQEGAVTSIKEVESGVMYMAQPGCRMVWLAIHSANA